MHPNRVSKNPSAGEDRVMWSKEHLLNGPLREAENELVQMIHIKLRNVVQFDVHLLFPEFSAASHVFPQRRGKL